MATITRRWIELDITKPGVLRAEDIPYDSTLTIKEAIDTKGAAGTEELMQYEFLHAQLPYKVCWYDLFLDSNYIDTGQTTANLDPTSSSFSGVAGDILQSVNILTGDTNTYYSFYFKYIASDYTLITPYYSLDGTNWIQIENDQRVVIEEGFSGTLIIRFAWSDTATLDSYAVFYDEQPNSFVSDVRMLEVYTVPQATAAPVDITLPNNAVYTTDGKSLEVYLNRVRLVHGIDYEEVDNRTVRFLIDLNANDTILFTEKFGYVDTSIENKSRLDYEHNEVGQHIFTDLTTGQKYRLAVDNGNLVLIPV